MDVKLGPLIKLVRKQQKLTQDELSIGICATSYLSRIENDIVVPDAQLVKLLLNRLGQDDQLLLNQYKEKRKALEEIYSKLLDDLSLTKDEIKLLIEESNLLLASFQQLVYVRYLLKENKVKEATLLIQPIIETIKFEKNRLTEVFISVSTYYHLLVDKYKKILELETTYYLSNYFINDHTYEKAIYSYHLSFATHRNYRFSLALTYITQASHLFTHNYRPLFQLKLYSMYGVIYNALNRYHDSLREYKAAIELLQSVPSIATNDQWASILNNQAYCYECMSKDHLAISNYKKSIGYKEDLHTIINYMRVLALTNKLEEVKALLEDYPVTRFTISHHLAQWSLIYAIANINNLPIEEFQKIGEKGYQSILKENHIELIIRYSPKLASIYSDHQMYKKAMLIYKYAFKTSQELLLNERT